MATPADGPAAPHDAAEDAAEDEIRAVADAIERRRREGAGRASSRPETKPTTGPAAAKPTKAPLDPAAARVAEATSEIERLQRLRARRTPSLEIGALVDDIRKTSKRIRTKLGLIVELWEHLVPQELASRTTITALRGGVLHVRADSALVAFEIDRLMREGTLATLRRQYPGTLARVKVSVG